MNRDLRIAAVTRKEINEDTPLFTTEKGVAFFYREAQRITFKYNEEKKKEKADYTPLTASKVHASAVLHYVYQTVLSVLVGDDDFFKRRIISINKNNSLKEALDYYSASFPSLIDEDKTMEENIRGYFVHQVMLENHALVSAIKPFIAPDGVVFGENARALSSVLSSFVKDDLRNGEPNTDDIFTFLCMPSRLYPDSLKDQLMYILREWVDMLPESFINILKSSLDYINEEERDHGFGGPGGESVVTDFSSEVNEYEAFSSDSDWMPCVVMIAKSTLVWLDQLSKKYHRSITKLNEIPDEELDILQHEGITALWLIGLWQRSEASKKIKHLCGNPDAVASAYSLMDYDISPSLGGWDAVNNLRERCKKRGIRLASDMVPNHTGIDGRWVYEHPEYFVSQSYSPFPSYTYNGPDLSEDPNWEVKIEDHYYNQTDAAVTFRMRNRHTGEIRYVFHGNDGTTMPWNDTAQLDYLNPVTREAVIQKILLVARNFPIIRFDAAMTLAKRHIERLWYPKPGTGGDIAGRAEHSMDEKEFNSRIPEEFWREVVDRVAKEVPDTLLLAEAFWMMEGYFVRTLGMHRVYNSAFMNMLKNQENKKYRDSIKNTLEFEPEILKRYVNFMNNPDEDTAISQFGDGDRYFGVATLLSTLPGLPMIGHGQIEGYKEKYGMEYQRAYYNETPNEYLVREHERRIFPLLRKRYLFANVKHFNLYDAYNNGNVEESVYAFVNGSGRERALVLVNNQFERVNGTINVSANKLIKDENGNKGFAKTRLAENLGLSFASRKYCLMDSFLDGLTYIYPSISLYDGFSFSLEGYESKVFWNIREEEDTDGLLEKLWKEYQGRGIKDISTAIAEMRLAPLYKILEPIRGKVFLETLESILKGDTSKEKERQLLLILAEVYSLLNEAYPNLGESTKGQMGKSPREMDPQPVISYMHTLGKLFSEKGSKALTYWYSTDSSLLFLVATSAVLLPFVSTSPRTMMEIADRLRLQSFFREEAEKRGINDENILRKLTHLSALSLSFASECKQEEEAPFFDILAHFLNDSAVMDLTGCHSDNGSVWYNKEKMQEALLTFAFAFAFVDKSKLADVDKYARVLLEKELNAGYKLSSLLKREN